MAAGPGRAWWRPALLSTLAGLALAGLGTVPGMGLPGALVAAPALPLIQALWGVSDAAMFPRDSAWPFFLVVTWALGPLVPLAWLGTRALGLRGWRRALAVAAALLMGGAAASVLVYAWGVAPLRPGA